MTKNELLNLAAFVIESTCANEDGSMPDPGILSALKERYIGNKEPAWKALAWREKTVLEMYKKKWEIDEEITS